MSEKGIETRIYFLEKCLSRKMDQYTERALQSTDVLSASGFHHKKDPTERLGWHTSQISRDYNRTAKITLKPATAPQVDRAVVPPVSGSCKNAMTSLLCATVSVQS